MQDEKNNNETVEEKDIIVSDTPGDDDTSAGEPEIEVRDAEDIMAEEPVEPEPYEPKLTPSQQKFWQIFLGIAFGVGIMVALFAGAFIDPDNELFSWLWLILFAVAMIGRSQIERRTGIRLRYFILALLISLAVMLGVFLIFGAVTGRFATE